MKKYTIMQQVAHHTPILFLACVGVGLIMTGCNKDSELKKTIRINAENHASGKTSVDGTYTYWVPDDVIWVNGECVEVADVTPVGTSATIPDPRLPLPVS